jgi:hypothetical protein
MIGQGCGLFDKGQGADEHGVVGDGYAGDAKVLQGPVGLDPVKDVVRDFNGPDAVMFLAWHRAFLQAREQRGK